jgi:group I intron endonuclease
MMIEGIIYKATNITNGQVYIGATTQNLENRKKDHLNKVDKSYNHKFQKAILEYGKENFNWEQIDTANNLNDLAIKESQYIEQYNSHLNGYNSDRGGGFKKIVYQFNLTGELESTFQTLYEASQAVSVSENSISHSCIGGRKTSNGYYWTYTATFDLKKDDRKKEVFQMSLNNEFLNSFESIAEATKITGVNKSSIAKCCRGERKKAGGFIWKFS